MTLQLRDQTKSHALKELSALSERWELEPILLCYALNQPWTPEENIRNSKCLEKYHQDIFTNIKERDSGWFDEDKKWNPEGFTNFYLKDSDIEPKKKEEKKKEDSQSDCEDLPDEIRDALIDKYDKKQALREKIMQRYISAYEKSYCLWRQRKGFDKADSYPELKDLKISVVEYWTLEAALLIKKARYDKIEELGDLDTWERNAIQENPLTFLYRAGESANAYIDLFLDWKSLCILIDDHLNDLCLKHDIHDLYIIPRKPKSKKPKSNLTSENTSLALDKQASKSSNKRKTTSVKKRVSDSSNQDTDVPKKRYRKSNNTSIAPTEKSTTRSTKPKSKKPSTNDKISSSKKKVAKKDAENTTEIYSENAMDSNTSEDAGIRPDTVMSAEDIKISAENCLASIENPNFPIEISDDENDTDDLGTLDLNENIGSDTDSVEI